MIFELLRKTVKNKPVFTPDDLHPAQPPKAHEWVQLSHWSQQGKIIRLRKGLYMLPEAERERPLDLLWLSNRLYEPSYVTLEYALSYYGLIPEAVGTVTAVSSRKTKRFKTPAGAFTYSTLKKEDFYGFVSVQSPGGNAFSIATPEKAVLDFIHLRVEPKRKATGELFLSGYRFQNLDRLDPGVFSETASRFSVGSTRTAGQIFLHMLKEETSRG